MIEENFPILKIAESWLARHPQIDGSDSSMNRSGDAQELMTTSRRVGRLLADQTPSMAALGEAAALFDRLAEYRQEDLFGERYEVCANLCYIAWRNAFLLGLEHESQEWLRIVDLLVAEDFTAKENLMAVLFLGEGTRSNSLLANFLGAPSDVFLALGILRFRRGQDSPGVLSASKSVFGWLSKITMDRASKAEQEFFRAEAAYLISTILRSLGVRAERKLWTEETRRLISGLPSNRPMRARLLCLRLVNAYDEHRIFSISARASVVQTELMRFGLYSEALRCRTAMAFLKKSRGDTIAATRELISLVQECRSSSEDSVLAGCLNDLAELHLLRGESDEAAELWVEATEAAMRSGDGTVIGSVSLSIGNVHLMNDRPDLAVVAFERGLASYSKLGSRTWVAYTEIWLAEALIASKRFAEARQHLAHAFSIVNQERMIPEGIHALKLLRDLNSSQFENEKRHS